MLPNFRKSDGDPIKPGFMPSAQIPAAAVPGHPAPTRPIGSPLRASERGMPSVIGSELRITGNLVSQGELQIEGEIQGDIHGSLVLVGEKAQITGGIVADEVVVRGHVMGSVRGKRVLLQSTSHVEGDIYHLTLAIEQGAYFEGKSRRTEDPTAGFGLSQPAQSRPPAGEDAAASQSAQQLAPAAAAMPDMTPEPSAEQS